MHPTANLLLRVFPLIHAGMALLFVAIAVVLMAIAARLGVAAIAAGIDRGAAQGIIEMMGLLAAAVVALQIGQTIAEEEVVRSAHVSAPTRVRRFLSRFLVVIVVALSIEALVATFRASGADAEGLVQAAAMVLASGGLLAGWGVFVHLNRSAEELEPEAMAEAKREDRKLRK